MLQELPVAAEHHRCRTRARVLVALYAWFLVVQGVHLLLHDHVSSVAHLDGPPSLAATCGDHCANPNHHHDGNHTAPCPICQVVHSISATPLTSSHTTASLAIERLTSTQVAPLPPPGHLASHPPRAPPLVRGPIVTA